MSREQAINQLILDLAKYYAWTENREDPTEADTSLARRRVESALVLTGAHPTYTARVAARMLAAVNVCSCASFVGIAG